MRRLVWLTVLAIALAVPAVGLALSGNDDGTLSVKGGIGKVYLNFNGSAVGRVAKGSIKVIDPNPDDGLGFSFSGCDVGSHDISDTTTIVDDSRKVARRSREDMSDSWHEGFEPAAAASEQSSAFLSGEPPM